MKTLKKTALLFAAALMLTGCQKQEPAAPKAEAPEVSVPAETPETAQTDAPEETIVTRVASLKGPTSMGLVKLMEDAKEGTASGAYDFQMYTSADEIVPLMVKGEVDIAAIPANLASVLYNKTEGQISVININTLGVLYLVENGSSIQSFADLKGKTVYMTGKGTTPEYAFQYLLAANQLSSEDVTVEFKSEPTEVANLLATEENAIGVLPQPFVTVACTQNENLRIALDLTREWDAVNPEGDSSMVTGVTVVRNEFLEQHPELVAAFNEAHLASTQYANTETEAAAALVEAYDIVKAPIAQKAIPYCYLTSIQGEDMKTRLSSYLNVLFAQNPESVGGKLPDETFYCLSIQE